MRIVFTENERTVMEMDCIDRKALRDALYDADAITMNGVKILNQFPAADVASARHGKWITVGLNYYARISQCTNCCAKYDFRPKYCPNCGALHDGEEV